MHTAILSLASHWAGQLLAQFRTRAPHALDEMLNRLEARLTAPDGRATAIIPVQVSSTLER